MTVPRDVANPPRLVATDLDGTMLRSDGSVSARSEQAISRLQEAGVEFVVATARPPEWLHDLTHVVGAHGVVICANGAYIYDVVNREILDERLLAKAVVLELVEALRAEIPEIAFAVQSRRGFGMEESYVDLYHTPAGTPVGPVDQLIDPLPGKLLARAPELEPQQFLDQVTALVGERAIVAFSGAGGLAEITAAGVTKAAVLAEWCAARGIDARDVWAFGDMPNDLPMLTWAGASFAVANGHPSVRDAATHVCPSNDDDGVAQIIESVLEVVG